jgi:hypothetical protein
MKVDSDGYVDNHGKLTKIIENSMFFRTCFKIENFSNMAGGNSLIVTGLDVTHVTHPV